MNKLTFDECGNFVGMCKSYFMSMEVFMGMGMEIFCGGMDFYVGHGIFGIEFFWSWNFCRTRRIFFFFFLLDKEFFVGHGKNFIFGIGFFVGHGIFVGFFCLLVLDMGFFA